MNTGIQYAQQGGAMAEKTDGTICIRTLSGDSEEAKEGVASLKDPEAEQTRTVSPSSPQKKKDMAEQGTSLWKTNKSEQGDSKESNGEQPEQDSEEGKTPQQESSSKSAESGGAMNSESSKRTEGAKRRPGFSSPLRKGKGRATSRGKKNPSNQGNPNRADPRIETDGDQGRPPPTKPIAVLSQVKKATEATKRSVTKIVPKRSSHESTQKRNASQHDAAGATAAKRKSVTFEEVEAADAFKEGTGEKDDTFPGEELSRRGSEHNLASSRGPRGVMSHIWAISSLLLRYSSIIVGLALVIAAFPTYLYWEPIRQNQMPIGVSLSWMLVSIAFGRELERVHASGEVLTSGIALEEQKVSAHRSGRPMLQRTVVVARDDYEIGKDQLDENHSIFRKATESFKRVRFRLWRQKKPFAKKPRKRMFWTNLSRSRQSPNKQRWEKNIGGAATSAPLLRGLYRDPSLRLRDIEPLEKEGDVLVDQDLLSVEPGAGLGCFDLASCTADTLKDHLVEPLLKLRGMDVYLTGDEGAQDDIGNHPFLIEHGLRSKKTCVVNVMIQWANVLIYFELPDWLEDFGAIVENDDDPDDVKALKRFLNGTDEYRNKRLKLLPALVDGTRLVKLLAPPKMEMTVSNVFLPVRWNMCNGDGQDKQPMVEVELDCQASKIMRGIGRIVKRHLSTTTIDLAVIIQKPDGSKEEEPSACVGMWRLDCLNIETCPRLPERVVSDQEVVRKASLALIGISPEEMAEIEAAAGPE